MRSCTSTRGGLINEANQKELEHEGNGYPSAIYKFDAWTYIDPFAKLTPETSPGVWLNPDRYRYNCRVVA